MITYFPLFFHSSFSAKSIARDLEKRDVGRPVRRKPGASSRGTKVTVEQPPNSSGIKSTETSPSKPGKSSEALNKPVNKSHGKKAAKLTIEDAIDDINQTVTENDTSDYEVSNSFRFIRSMRV